MVSLVAGRQGVKVSFTLHTASTPTTPGGGESGECFLVERYESDLEEEGDVEQLLVTLSDTFLEEKNINGKVRQRSDSQLHGSYWPGC